MVFLALLFVSSLEIGDLIKATKRQQRLRFVSACFLEAIRSGDKADTMRQRSGDSVSTLSTLRNTSKVRLEVLCLGLVWVQSQNFHHCNEGYFE
jgi:hypothetical protein